MLDKSQQLNILLEAEGLSEGDSFRLKCPVCGGGTGRELSFVCNVIGTGVRYVCYRSSCGVRSGYISSSGRLIENASRYSNKTKREGHRPYIGDLFPLPDPVLGLMERRFQIGSEWLVKYGV